MDHQVLCVVFYIFFAVSLSASIAVCLALSKKKSVTWLERVIKIATVSYLTLSIIDVFLPDLFMCSHELDALASMKNTSFHAILRWLNSVSFTVLPIAVFQKNKYIILEVVLNLFYGEEKEILKKCLENLETRKQNQPYDKFSAGSVFKKVNNIPAWKIIESVGFRGYKVGGAMISRKHCGFIVNVQSAKFYDVLKYFLFYPINFF